MRKLSTSDVLIAARWLALPVLLLPYLGQRSLYYAYLLYWSIRSPAEVLVDSERPKLVGMAEQFAYDINISYEEYAYGPIPIVRIVVMLAAFTFGFKTRKNPMISAVASYFLFIIALFVPPYMSFDPLTCLAILHIALAFSRMPKAKERSQTSSSS